MSQDDESSGPDRECRTTGSSVGELENGAVPPTPKPFYVQVNISLQANTTEPKASTLLGFQTEGREGGVR